MTFPKLRFRTRARRTRLAAYLAIPLVVALSAVACEDDPVEPEEPSIATVRLTVGSQTINITGSGTPTVTISGASTAVSATFLEADGSTLTLDGAEFEIRLTPANAGVLTFTRSTPFSGTLNRVAAGTTTIQVEVFHKIEGHEDFGPFPISVTVQ